MKSLIPTTILLAAVLGAVTMFAQEPAQRQYYELRVYKTQSEEQQKQVNDYWQNAGIPAYNRMGIQPIGVFTELKDSPTNKVYVVIPFDSLDEFASVLARLASDAAYQSAAATYLNLTKPGTAYDRIESSLNVAFDTYKKLTPPPSAADKRPWIFELRTYESPSEGKGVNKVQMFNSGEVPLMQDTGLNPVFFSQTLIGPQMPNLVYMVSGPNMEEHKKHWKAFQDSPIWKKLIGDPQYKDNVSHSVNIFLKRTSASQI
ncbi:MAG TPA: NIPSNAP family protein [Verrucomicrobiae bacterium]|jgi:hypothetical protein|nr:NIPSNAP family protein [Verrucomicrobiae bacterium]